jgi:hypothetical protein
MTFTNRVEAPTFAVPARPRSKALAGRPLRVIREIPLTVLAGTEPLGPSRVATVERALLDAASRPRLVSGATRVAESLTAVTATDGLAELAHVGVPRRDTGGSARSVPSDQEQAAWGELFRARMPPARMRHLQRSADIDMTGDLHGWRRYEVRRRRPRRVVARGAGSGHGSPGV